ncbi:hypothetical protein BDU57DRAFT_535157 [Ampelomyces quisqualis]|uniref:Uncharacterized protein n=1 Tax=Ampelomyces quisqualis TaxID=50730 RepID=A0A6A5R0C4_AMPQU|nr:hypothetical protein BDU57DRAFT_535157 [Ampelomyces quisqualis]
MVNALFTVAALLCEVSQDGDGMGSFAKVSFDELHHFHGYGETLIDDRAPGYDQLKAHAQIVICRDRLLYSIIAVLVTFIIDPEVLSFPLVALVMAVVFVPILASPKDVERIVDLSAFRIEWTAVPVVKHTHYYLEKTADQPTNKGIW